MQDTAQHCPAKAVAEPCSADWGKLVEAAVLRSNQLTRSPEICNKSNMKKMHLLNVQISMCVAHVAGITLPIGQLIWTASIRRRAYPSGGRRKL